MPAAVNSSVVNSTRTVEVKTMESLPRCLPGAMAVLCITSRVHQRCRPVAAPLVAHALQSTLNVLALQSRHSNARRSSAHGAGVAGGQRHLLLGHGRGHDRGRDLSHDRVDRKSTRLNSSHLGTSYAV